MLPDITNFAQRLTISAQIELQYYIVLDIFIFIKLN